MEKRKKIYVVEAAQSDAWIRRRSPTPPENLRGRVVMVGPFFDYGAARHWFDAHLGLYEAMVIHALTSPGKLETRHYGMAV